MFAVLLMSSMTFAVGNCDINEKESESIVACEFVNHIWAEAYYMYTVKPDCFHVVVLIWTNTSLQGDFVIGAYEANVGDGCGGTQFISDVEAISGDADKYVDDPNVVKDIKTWYDNYTP